MFLFTAASLMFVCLLAGLAPGIQCVSRSVVPALKGETGLRALGRFSFANVLVIAQVALSLVLLFATGLFLRSLRNLRSVDLGFDPARLVLLTVASDTRISLRL